MNAHFLLHLNFPTHLNLLPFGLHLVQLRPRKRDLGIEGVVLRVQIDSRGSHTQDNGRALGVSDVIGPDPVAVEVLCGREELDHALAGGQAGVGAVEAEDLGGL